MSDNLSIAPISVVIPCYNASSHLERAVNSVLSQTLLPAEIILVDDASIDDNKTKDLILRIELEASKKKQKIKVKHIFLAVNRGPGGARNAGWEIATQPWIAFLDADDAWGPKKIAFQYQCIHSHTSIDLLAHRCSFRKIDGNQLSSASNLEGISPEKVTFRKMLYSNLIPTRSVILRREIPLRFPENTLSEDYSLWLKILAAGYEVRLMNEVLAYTFRPEYSDGGSSGQLWRQERGELRALTSLYQAGSIQFFVYLIASSWSLLKFLRRFIMRTLHL